MQIDDRITARVDAIAQRAMDRIYNAPRRIGDEVKDEFSKKKKKRLVFGNWKKKWSNKKQQPKFVEG